MESRLPASDKALRFFSSFAETWDSLYGRRRNALQRLLDNRLRRDIYERYAWTLERLPETLEGKTVLDVGCGSGVYCFEAARRGAREVIGLDGAPGMIAVAQRRVRELRLEAACRFVELNFPPDDAAAIPACDYVIVMGVMDYIADAAGFLRALRRHAKSLALLSFPGAHWLRAPLRRYRYKLLGRCEVYNYDEDIIRALCAAAGFLQVEIVRLDHSGVCYLVAACP